MAIDAFQAAKYLCEESGWTLTNLEVQKMLYFCHMAYLGQKGQPLIEGDFEALGCGPVHSTIYYYLLKKFGSSPINRSAFDDDCLYPITMTKLDGEKHRAEINALDTVIKYFNSDRDRGPKLVAVTQWNNSAWIKSRVKAYKFPSEEIIISPDAIKQEYQDLQCQLTH